MADYYPGPITVMITRGTEAAGLKIPLDTADQLGMSNMTVEEMRDNLRAAINREATVRVMNTSQAAAEELLGTIEDID